ncbi:MAG: lactonase family protein [Bacteroidales bacterium]|nr:lactonase family protein [Bacteroidales bacterium]
MRITILALFTLSLFISACENKNELNMVVGTYTDGDSKGMYSYTFNQETGKATALSEIEVSNPSYLTFSENGNFIYSVSENVGDEATANAFSFDKKSGQMKLINRQKTQGDHPCHIATDGKNVVVANYTGGSFTTYKIEKDGSLSPATSFNNFKENRIGPDTVRQSSSHIHCAVFAPDNKHLFVTDLGADRIYRYKINHKRIATEKPAFTTIAPGSGPRHFTFAPDGKHAYLINELSGTIVSYLYHQDLLEPLQTVRADSVGGRGSADIHISPDGKYLYASNRLQSDGIAIFSINPESGKLAKVGYQLIGIHPRNFIITPNGKFLLVACRDSNVIQVYLRDLNTGLLTDTKQDIALSKPVCIQFASSN